MQCEAGKVFLTTEDTEMIENTEEKPRKKVVLTATSVEKLSE